MILVTLPSGITSGTDSRGPAVKLRHCVVTFLTPRIWRFRQIGVQLESGGSILSFGRYSQSILEIDAVVDVFQQMEGARENGFCVDS